MANWAVGDFAMCIHRGRWRNADTGLLHTGPKPGQFFTVEEVGICGGQVVLGFPEWPELFHAARHFIKVTPPRDLIEQERREQVPA